MVWFLFFNEFFSFCFPPSLKEKNKILGRDNTSGAFGTYIEITCRIWDMLLNTIKAESVIPDYHVPNAQAKYSLGWHLTHVH